MLIGGNIGV